jgi:hypothetical protein
VLCSLVEVYRRFRGVCCWVITLMMEATSTSEMLINFYQTTQCYNPEDGYLHASRRENLKSYYCEFHLHAHKINLPQLWGWLYFSRPVRHHHLIVSSRQPFWPLNDKINNSLYTHSILSMKTRKRNRKVFSLRNGTCWHTIRINSYWWSNCLHLL